MNSRLGKFILLATGLLLFVTVIIGMAGCKSGEPGPNPASTTSPVSIPTAPPTSAPDNKTVILTVVNGSQTKTYTMAALRALPPTIGTGGWISTNGQIKSPNMYSGVAVNDLVKIVGGMTESNAVKVSAKSGASVTLSFDQVTKGDFLTFDSVSGKSVTPTYVPVAFIAHELDIRPLSDDIGPLRLGTVTFAYDVTEQKWWLDGVQKIEVITAP
jgi:hypothetical protein